LNVKNLHSLINGRWFIYEPYGHSLLPSLHTILGGNSVPLKLEDREPDLYISTKSSNKANVVAAYNDGHKSNDNYVAIINLKDPIYKYNQECGPRGTKSKMLSMQNFENDPNCIGVVLDIDSGGGQVSGTPEFYDYIRNFSKPVVSYTDGMMCSAAYYIGAASSWIIANKRADAIGSIGVMVYFINTEGIFVNQGATVITEYATKSTEKNRAFEELLDGKPELYIKTELDPIADEFISDIKTVRTSVPEDVFKGGTWNANEALANNLIDEIGSLQIAIDKVFELSESSNSNNNINSKSKKKSMAKKTKKFSAIQGILGIEGDGIDTISTMTGKTGVQITEAQLETLENALVEKDANVTKVKGQVTKLRASVNEAVATAGLKVEANATTSTKITLLGAEVVKRGKKPGADASKPKAEGDKFEEATDNIVNEADSHNDFYNKA